MTRRTILLCAGLPLVVATAAHASFLNAPIDLEYVARDGNAIASFAEDSATVVAELDGSLEFPAFLNGEPTFDVDVDAFTITIDHFFQPSLPSDTFDNPPFLGLVFIDASNAIAPIQSVTIVTPSAMPGIDGDGRVGRTVDSISVNWAGLSFTPNTSIDLLVTFAPDDGPAGSIPEPASLAADGLFVLLLSARRRLRSTSSGRSLSCLP